MTTKFERDEYGLRLELVGANDNERVLINELLSLSPSRIKEKNLTVTRSGADGIAVARPIFIQKGFILARGFVYAPKDGINIYYKRIEGQLLILKSSGIANLYVFDSSDAQPISIIQFDINMNEFNFYDDTANYFNTYSIADAIATYSGLHTLKQLDEVLKNY